MAAPSAETLSGSISGSQVLSNGGGGVSISGSRFLFPDITFALQTPSGSALTGAGGVMAAWMTISSEPVNGLPLVTLVPESSSLSLLALGMIWLGWVQRQRHRRPG